MLKVVSAMPEEPTDEYETVRRAGATARARLTEIDAAIKRLKIANWNASDAGNLDVAAEAYLADPSRSGSSDVDLKKLDAEREVVARAVGIASEKIRVIQEAQIGAFVKSLRPAHRQAAARVVECLIDLAEANAAEAKIRLRAPGGRLPFLSFPSVDLGRPNTAAKHFLAYLKRAYSIVPVPRTKAAE